MNKLLLALLLFLLSFSWIKVTASDSCPASFPWKAQWINTERCQSATNTWLIYRKSFAVTNVPNQLIARIAADSKYWLWINDQLVIFEGGLKRGPSPSGTYYDPVDIAPYLTKGSNTIAILLWHFGKDGFSHINSGKAALLFEAIAPGLEIVSDASWQCALYEAYQNTEAPFPNYRMPESNIRFDARQAITNWNRTSSKVPFRGRSASVRRGKLLSGIWWNVPIPQWKNSGLLSYVSVRESLRGDTLFCRLPYNAQITPYLKVEAEAGKTIHIRMDNYEEEASATYVPNISPVR